ncbi:tripartite tricarboxylate transporter TctB family protein [Modestobacter sp. Leaf380]|uniref:tripartite tricarboxylate transporter TctB family protein n=1 Tax=Modestobacter sp. Leaf380 TaxID=1736356 RepID=UPI0009E74EA6|nr:tripartite tricarboxylate transporter TctB family protein [Modestobacter sp. Leaf380]
MTSPSSGSTQHDATQHDATRPAVPGQPGDGGAGASPAVRGDAGSAPHHAVGPDALPDAGVLPGATAAEADDLVDEVAEEDRPPTAGPVTNLATAVVTLGIGVAVLLGSLSLGVGTAEAPGPGTWPLLVAIALIALSVATAVASRRTTDAEAFTSRAWGVLAGLATLVGFVLLIDVIGFEVPAVLLCFVWLRFLGREGWRTSVLVSLGVVAVFYALFVVALSVPIPHLF